MVVLEIANSVSPNTRLSVDYPSAHRSGWMPLLDIQVRVASDNTIDWTFFRKPVSTPNFFFSTGAPCLARRRGCAWCRRPCGA